MSIIGRTAVFLATPPIITTYSAWADPAANGQTTFSNSSRSYTTSSGFVNTFFGALGKTSGKWSFENTATAQANYTRVGISNGTSALYNPIGNAADAIVYDNSGNILCGGVVQTGFASWTEGDVISVEYDAPTGSVQFKKNGVLQAAVPSTISGTIYPACGSSFTAAISGNTNFGNAPFSYPTSSGYAVGVY